jgi:hypothetical protein
MRNVNELCGAIHQVCSQVGALAENNSHLTKNLSFELLERPLQDFPEFKPA